MDHRNGASLIGRVALVALTIYALAMVAPDLLRLAAPLSSFGLAADANGLIYDVQGPFYAEEESPAWRAGLRRGDRIDVAAMRCIPIDTEVCATNLSLWGGVNYVMAGRVGTFKLLANGEHPAREVKLVAETRPVNRLLDVVIALQQVAGILVILGAAWLVWTRPGPMTWGFFVYMIQFNPGMSFLYYAWLQQWAPALLAQNFASCVLQAAGYAGFLLFALRAPIDRAEGRWRAVQRALPALAAAFFVIEAASLASLFGFRAESLMQMSVLIGFVVSAAALGILLGRRRDLSPKDYQRVRWVIWGCLIGLPAYLLAELFLETSLFSGLLDDGAVPEEVAGLLYLINGILCLFVVEAVRRPTVVNVWIPLRRATALGLLLSVPVLFLHKQIETIDEYIHMPDWAWILVASGLVYLIARAHEFATELAERLFNRRFVHAEARLAEIGETLQHAASLDEVERFLVHEPKRLLGLASAALFREEGGTFRRRASDGWDAEQADTLGPEDQLLAARFGRKPYRPDPAAMHRPDSRLPSDVARPILAVPVGNARRCYALALYSGHEAGTDLDGGERRLLETLARDAEIAYAQIESETLHDRVSALESQLAQVPEPRSSRRILDP
jgi:hypothetical protein